MCTVVCFCAVPVPDVAPVIPGVVLTAPVPGAPPVGLLVTPTPVPVIPPVVVPIEVATGAPPAGQGMGAPLVVPSAGVYSAVVDIAVWTASHPMCFVCTYMNLCTCCCAGMFDCLCVF